MTTDYYVEHKPSLESSKRSATEIVGDPPPVGAIFRWTLSFLRSLQLTKQIIIKFKLKYYII
jgi:hypothetical protein